MELSPPDEDGCQLVINVRDFLSQHQELSSLLARAKEDQTNDAEVLSYRYFKKDSAEETLGLALTAFECARNENAWFLLTEAALAIGCLQGSQGAHLRSDQASSRSRKENAARGGKKKGENAREHLKAIALEVLHSLPKGQIFDKRAIRRAFNKVTADQDLKDVDRKFRELCTLEIIASVMAKPGNP